jgi:sporulation protein YlmC with PRC-barrel domain
MKTMMLTAGLLCSALMATTAMAQTSPAPATQPSATGPSAAPGFLTRLEPGQMLLSKVMDGDVFGADNKDIGDVEDVVLDRSGKVVGLVIEVEEGRDRTVALPLSAFQINADAATTGSVQTGSNAAARNDDLRILVNVPVDQLKAAPEFDDNDD